MSVLRRHIQFSLLADIAEGRVVAGAAEADHLAACPACAAELAWLQRTLSLLRSTELEEPPAEPVDRVKALFRRHRPVPKYAAPRLLTAILRFDSASGAPAFGLRSAGALERQLLFHADPYALDLRLSPAAAGWAVAGQLLGLEQPVSSAAVVELLGANGRVETALNELFEFVLAPVRPGRYQLTVLLDEQLILIPDLELGV